MSFDAVRRSSLDGLALPPEARALGFATRLILRGGADVVAPVEAAFGVAPPLKPMGSAAAGERAALWLGPDEWLLIAEDEAGDLMARLETALAPVFHTLVDVSHRQTALALEGARAARLLASGCPLDLDLKAFPVGMATRTLFVKAEVGLWRQAQTTFRIEVGRSFAPYVAHMLSEAARNLGEA